MIMRFRFRLAQHRDQMRQKSRRRLAEIIQRTRPDVLLVNEFDYDPTGQAAQDFNDNYLNVPHGDAAPIDYPYMYAAPSNTGVPSGRDFDNDGSSNLFEYLAGSNPVLADLAQQPLPELVANPDGSMSVVFRALPNRTYRVEYSDDLVEWSDASGTISVGVETEEFMWIDDGSMTGGLPIDGVRRFYRISISMPSQ